MKLRIGFVSNSSTASFVIVGFDISKQPEARKRFEELTECNIENDSWEIDGSRKLRECFGESVTFRIGHSESGIREGAEVLGLLIAEVHSDGGADLSDKEFSFVELQSKLFNIAQMVGLNAGDAKLFTGTRMA